MKDLYRISYELVVNDIGLSEYKYFWGEYLEAVAWAEKQLPHLFGDGTVVDPDDSKWVYDETYTIRARLSFVTRVWLFPAMSVNGPILIKANLEVKEFPRE